MLQVTRPTSRTERNEWLLFLLLVGPNLILFGLFTYWPLVYNGYLSFVRWDFLGPRRWVGWENYTRLFTDSSFGEIILNTVIFTFGSMAILFALGLAIALLLNQPLKGRNAVRAVVFSPVMLSGAAIGIVWLYIFDPRYGLLDIFISGVGLKSPNWLLESGWAMAAVITVHVWKNIGYAVVIFLAGLQGIPRGLYEAATVDGAGGWAQFRYVTLPGLSPIMFFLLVTTILGGFQAFDIIHVMTEGGPVNATTTLIYYMYEEGFSASRAGRAAVSAMTLFIAMLIFTLIQMRYSERSVNYA